MALPLREADNRLVAVEDATRIRKPVMLPGPGVPAPRSFVHAPIAIEERPIGVLSAYSSTGRVYFSPEFIQFFRTLAVQLGSGSTTLGSTASLATCRGPWRRRWLTGAP